MYLDNTYISSLDELKEIIESHTRNGKVDDKFRLEFIETFEDNTDTGLLAFVKSIETDETKKYAEHLSMLEAKWDSLSASEQFSALVKFFNVIPTTIDLMKYIEITNVEVKEQREVVDVIIKVKVKIPINEFISFKLNLYNENNYLVDILTTNSQSLCIPINKEISFRKRFQVENNIDRIEIVIGEKIIKQERLQGSVLTLSSSNLIPTENEKKEHLAFISSYGYNHYKNNYRIQGEPDVLIIKDDETVILAIGTIVSAHISEICISYEDIMGLKTTISYDGIIENHKDDVTSSEEKSMLRHNLGTYRGNRYYTQFFSAHDIIVREDGYEICVLPKGINALYITSSGIIIIYKRDYGHLTCAFGLMSLEGNILVDCKYAFAYYGENQQLWGGYPYEIRPGYFDMRGSAITNFDEINNSTYGYVEPIFEKTNLRYFDVETHKWYISTDPIMEDSFDSLWTNNSPLDDGLSFEDTKFLADGFYYFPKYLGTYKNMIFSSKFGIISLEPNEQVLTKLVSNIDEKGNIGLQEKAFISEGKIITEIYYENNRGIKELRIRDYKGNIMAKCPGFIKKFLERPFQYGKALLVMSSSIFYISEDGEQHYIKFEEMDFPAFYHEKIDEYFGDFGIEFISPEIVWIRQKSAQYLVNVDGTVLKGGKDVVFLKMSNEFVCCGSRQDNESDVYKFGVCDMFGRVVLPNNYAYPFLPTIIHVSDNS